jgi:S-methylmethionine-dependent homocysteine/selenocysteine methylase
MREAVLGVVDLDQYPNGRHAEIVEIQTPHRRVGDGPSARHDKLAAETLTPVPILLDGPVGTELTRRGVDTPLPLWTAAAIEDAPDVLASIHRDYAAAGARVHTANTFRTGPYTFRHDRDPDRWRRLTDRAVAIARSAVDDRVAGSMAPLEDCYRPDLSPEPDLAREAHERMARGLLEAGVDLLLCETFPHPEEALIAVEAALGTSLPVWLSLTVGPTGDLIDDEMVEETLRRAVELGVEAVLVNCARPQRIAELLPRLAGLGVPFGAYGNVGEPDDRIGWRSDGSSAPEPYADEVVRWIAAGATLVGGCCGTTPAHIAALKARVG